FMRIGMAGSVSLLRSFSMNLMFCSNRWRIMFSILPFQFRRRAYVLTDDDQPSTRPHSQPSGPKQRESIFVEYDAIDHHGIAFAGKLHMYRDTNLDSSPNDIWVEHLTAFSHIDHFFAEVIGAWSTALLEHYHASGRVLGDRAGAVGGGRCRCRR